jgi:hypothetical protein
MAYVALTDIQAHLQNLTISSTSKPTTLQVNGFISLVEAQVDQRLRVLGMSTVPAVDNEIVTFLKPIIIHGVLAMVYRGLNAESEAAATFQSLFDAAMDLLEKDPAIVKIEETASAAVPAGGYSATVSELERTFQREKKQW